MSVESIPKAIDRSITNDMRTYSVVENDDFTNSAKVLEPRSWFHRSYYLQLSSGPSSIKSDS